MHTPIQVLMERFCEESQAVQDKYGHLLDIVRGNENFDEELFQMKRDDYAARLREDLAEITEKYKRIAHHDSHADQERLKEQLTGLQEKDCGAFLARYHAKNPDVGALPGVV